MCIIIQKANKTNEFYYDNKADYDQTIVQEPLADLEDAIVDLEDKNAELDMVAKYQRAKGSNYYATDVDGKIMVRAVSELQEKVLKFMAKLKAGMALGKKTKKVKK